MVVEVLPPATWKLDMQMRLMPLMPWQRPPPVFDPTVLDAELSLDWQPSSVHEGLQDARDTFQSSWELETDFISLQLMAQKKRIDGNKAELREVKETIKKLTAPPLLRTPPGWTHRDPRHRQRNWHKTKPRTAHKICPLSQAPRMAVDPLDTYNQQWVPCFSPAIKGRQESERLGLRTSVGRSMLGQLPVGGAWTQKKLDVPGILSQKFVRGVGGQWATEAGRPTRRESLPGVLTPQLLLKQVKKKKLDRTMTWMDTL